MASRAGVAEAPPRRRCRDAAATERGRHRPRSGREAAAFGVFARPETALAVSGLGRSSAKRRTRLLVEEVEACRYRPRRGSSSPRRRSIRGGKWAMRFGRSRRPSSSGSCLGPRAVRGRRAAPARRRSWRYAMTPEPSASTSSTVAASVGRSGRATGPGACPPSASRRPRRGRPSPDRRVALHARLRDGERRGADRHGHVSARRCGRSPRTGSSAAFR